MSPTSKKTGSRTGKPARSKTSPPSPPKGSGRTRTERRIEESEENYRLLFELSADAITVHDGKTIQMINPAGARLLGAARPEDLIGKPIVDFIHPDDQQMVRERFEQQRKGQAVPRVTEKLIRLDGTIVDAEVVAVPYRYKDAPATLVIARDVTERKMAEEALRRSEVRFRALIENGWDGLTLVDRQNKIIYASPSNERTIGYRREEREGKSAVEFIHPDDLDLVVGQHLKVSETPGAAHHLEYRARDKNGEWKWIESIAHNLLDEPSVQAIVVNFRDITERKQTEQALRDSETRLRALIENSWEALTLVDRENRIIYYGPSNERISGFTSEEMLGRYAHERIHPDDQATAAARRRKYSTLPGAVVSAEYRIRHKDGHWVWVESTAHNLLDQPNVAAMVIHTRDISQHKQAESLLVRNESRLSQAIQLAGLGIWDWDLATDKVEWRGEMFRIYGITPESFTGKGEDYINFTRADYRETQQENIKKAFEHGITEADLLAGKGVSPDPKELCIVRPDGSECYTLGDAVCIVDEDGKPLRMLGITQDITERKQAEARLRESENRFRLLIEQAPVAIILSRDGLSLYANPQFVRSFGFQNAEEIIGRPILDLIASQGREATQERMRRRSQHLPLPPEFETIALRKDGSQFPVLTAVAQVQLLDGQANIAFITDITARKQAEQIQARLTAILEATPDYVGIADPDGHSTYINRAGRRMVGLGEDENISGLSIRDLSPPWANKIIAEVGIPTAIRDGVWSGETARLARDGRQIPVAQVILAHKDSNGDLEYLSTISRDISERKQAEQRIQRQLEHLTALSEIDRAITSSFDLRQSLETLLGHVTRQLQVDAADVLLYDAQAQALRYGAGMGFRAGTIQTLELPVDETNEGRAIFEAQIINIPNLNEEPGHTLRTDLLAEEGFISYSSAPLIAKGELKGVLEVFRRSPFQPDEEWLDFFSALAGQAAIAIENAGLFSSLQHSNRELSLAYDATIEGWSRALDLRDKETEGHTQRVTDMTVRLARAFGLSEAELVQVRWGALLHDIGKMGVPDQILFKAGPLTEEEWIMMRKHPAFAYEMLLPIGYLHEALDIPYCHHEKWDGSGYPRGLKGEEIPLTARIFAVVDVWDALSSDRPYRSAWPEEKVIAYLRSLSGAYFDPRVVRVCLDSGLLTRPGRA